MHAGIPVRPPSPRLLRLHRERVQCLTYPLPCPSWCSFATALGRGGIAALTFQYLGQPRPQSCVKLHYIGPLITFLVGWYTLLLTLKC